MKSPSSGAVIATAAVVGALALVAIAYGQLRGSDDPKPSAVSIVTSAAPPATRPPTTRAPRPIPTAPPVTGPVAARYVTEEEWNALRRGMSYDEVASIVGSEGRCQAIVNYGQTCVWDGPIVDSGITVGFSDAAGAQTFYALGISEIDPDVTPG